jgi:hypothetical protein
MRLLRIATLALLLGLGAEAAGMGEAPSAPVPTKFKGTADLLDAVQIVSGFSDDKQVVTVLFRNLQAGIGGLKGPLVNTRTATLTLALDSKDKESRVTQDVRGFVAVQGKARAVLVVQAAGKTTLVDLKKSQVKDKEKPDAEGALKQARDRAMSQAKDFSPPEKGAQMFDFVHRIDGMVPAGTSYQVTFFLLVERDTNTEEAGAQLSIDSLDVALGELAKNKE